MAEENTDPSQQKIIDLLSQIASDSDDTKKEERANKRNRNFKKNTQAVLNNGLALVGLTTSMFSLTAMIGNQLKMNQDLAVALGQTGDATKGMTAATDRFLRGQQGAEQMVTVFKDAVDTGITKFSDQTLRFGAQLKVLGIQNKTAFRLMRANTQGLGLAEEASLNLSQELITTAIENKDSISGLIDAINSMKEAMIDTTVELGPNAAMNAQKIAAMMSQGNSELQESSAKFVKSFLAGSDGYMKAAKLGVQFTGKESTAEMARKFETILGKIQSLQAGKQGAGSQFFFDSMEKSFGLSREDFNLQTQIGTNIESLKRGNVQQLANDSARINLQQTIWNKTEPFQTFLMNETEKFTSKINDIFDVITEMNETLGKYLLPIVGGVLSLVGFLGVGTLLGVLWKPFKWLGKGLWNVGKWTSGKLVSGFKWVGTKILNGLGALGSKLANAVFGVTSATMKSSGKVVGGAAAKSAVKAGSATAIQKGLLKGFVKKIPLIGALAGAGFAIHRAIKGDFTGAAMELGSGLASTVPGLGTAASVGIDAALIARDVKNAGGDQMAEEAKQRTELMDTGMSNLGNGEGNSAANAIKENTAVLREILESSNTNNSLVEEQTEVVGGRVEPSPIRAGY